MLPRNMNLPETTAASISIGKAVTITVLNSLAGLERVPEARVRRPTNALAAAAAAAATTERDVIPL